jgi:hypothetical protein
MYLKVLFQQSLGASEENHKNSVRMAGNQAKIQTYLQNTTVILTYSVHFLFIIWNTLASVVYI